jgi:dolichyldiphosphatase
MTRQPFGMFYVLVDPDKPLEKLLALITMAPYFIVCALVTLSLRCRELLTITWLIGQLLNEAINFFLKRLLQQSRPAGAPQVGFDGHGMPSAHSQFMGFFLSFSLCVVLFRIRANLILRLGISISIVLLAFAVFYSRLELGFHTFDQVCQSFVFLSCKTLCCKGL